MRKFITAVALATLAACTSLAHAQGGQVCFDLRLTVREGGVVNPGDSIGWSIDVFVSSGDNQGLAMALVDLEQGPDNPEPIALTATKAPSTMKDFDRPRGIANRGEGLLSGYGGRKMPVAAPRGGTKLIQIGGAQNNFGQPGTAGIAEDTNVESGVGQGSRGQLLAASKFAAPQRCGVYKLYLTKPIANTLVYVQPAPGFSEVAPATVTLCDGETYFYVSSQFCLLDIDQDDVVSPADLYALIERMVTEPVVDPAQFPEYPRADVNRDGFINGEDLFRYIDELLRSDGFDTMPVSNNDHAAAE